MLQPGQSFDRYRIEALLGQGGMGSVYLAFDPRLNRRVALKLVRLDGQTTARRDELAQRLLREARAAAAIEHPGAVAVHDTGEIEGVAFLVMEYVPGRTLRAFIGDRSIPVEHRVEWLVAIARVLAAAHGAGLVHRDVKPENVMVRQGGGIKVLDFGTARRAAAPIDPTAPSVDDGLGTITQHGDLVGTVRYMAPEQLQGRPVDARTDQFAFGVVAHELLTGRWPWPTDGDFLVLGRRIVGEEPLGFAASRDVPPAVAAVIWRTLRKDPAARFASMLEVAAALEAAAPRRGRVADR